MALACCWVGCAYVCVRERGGSCAVKTNQTHTQKQTNKHTPTRNSLHPHTRATHRRHVIPALEYRHRVLVRDVALRPHIEDTQARHQDVHRMDHKGEEHEGRGVGQPGLLRERRTEDHRADDLCGHGFEDVGGAAHAVADHVACEGREGVGKG